MTVNDAAVFDTTFTPAGLDSTVKAIQDGAVKDNIQQLAAVAAICNAANFQGAPKGVERVISGDATGSYIIHARSSHALTDFYQIRPSFASPTRLQALTLHVRSGARSTE